MKTRLTKFRLRFAQITVISLVVLAATVSLPIIGKTLTFDGHFGIGGFGAASEFTWQAFPSFNWHFSKWGSAQLGYRWLGTDYETGSGFRKFRYDVIVHGPQLGLTVRF